MKHIVRVTVGPEIELDADKVQGHPVGAFVLTKGEAIVGWFPIHATVAILTPDGPALVQGVKL